MSQEELKKYFEFEKKKHFDFFLPYYRDKNWQLEKDNINSGCKNDWDVQLEIFADQYVLVDEKARQGDYGDFLVEIIQDIKTGSLGWYFSKKDWILYGSWSDIESVYPASLYLIRVRKLEEYINSLEGFIKICISKKGWGNTWNLQLSWDELIRKAIAQKLI